MTVSTYVAETYAGGSGYGKTRSGARSESREERMYADYTRDGSRILRQTHAQNHRYEIKKIKRKQLTVTAKATKPVGERQLPGQSVDLFLELKYTHYGISRS